MKNVLFTTMLNVKDHGVGVMKQWKASQKQIYPKEVLLILLMWWEIKGILYYELFLQLIVIINRIVPN